MFESFHDIFQFIPAWRVAISVPRNSCVFADIPFPPAVYTGFISFFYAPGRRAGERRSFVASFPAFFSSAAAFVGDLRLSQSQRSPWSRCAPQRGHVLYILLNVSPPFLSFLFPPFKVSLHGRVFKRPVDAADQRPAHGIGLVGRYGVGIYMYGVRCSCEYAFQRCTSFLVVFLSFASAP